MSGNASVLVLSELAVRRDARGRVTGVRTGVGGAPSHEAEIHLDPSDPLDDLISNALERDLQAPFLDSVRYVRAAEAITRRGHALSSALKQALGEGVRAPGEWPSAINVVGSSALFDVLWEALLLEGADAPVALQRPVVRVVAGAAPYPFAWPSDGLRVTVITARLNWSTDIPPRQVTQTLADLQARRQEFRIGVVTPAFPNQIEASIVPSPGAAGTVAGAVVLHIDAHGVLLSYEDLVRRHGAWRAEFVEKAWGLEVPPYEGLKSFVLVNKVLPNGEIAEFPISGEELGALCRQAGIPLVVLNACRAASADAEGGIAIDLVRAGVPDVIAFRHALTAASAMVLVSSLYEALADGLSPAQACCAAREALHAAGVKAVLGVALPFPDWISLVHYASHLVGGPDTVTPRPPARPVYAPPRLPGPLEWAVFKVQEMIYRMRLSEIVGNAALPAKQPLILYGPIGAGAESLLIESASWLAHTDIEVSGTRFFDVGEGLAPALRHYFPSFDLGWSDHQVADAIVDQWGPSLAVAFVNLDLALDCGVIDLDEYQRIYRLAAILSRRIGPCLVHSSRDLAVERFARDIGVPVLATFRCGPVTTQEIEHWLLSEPGDDPQDRMVAWLLAWISAGHVDIAALSRVCTSPGQRQFLLDHLVLGTRILNPPLELEVLHDAVQSRWRAMQDRIDLSPLLPLVAAVGSGIALDELSHVGKSLGGREFPLISRVTFPQLAPLLTALTEASLLATHIRRAPPGWDSKSDIQLAALRLNPMLRPLARLGLSSELREELDRWAVAWALDKFDFFTQEWLDPQRRPQIKVYLEYAWPLFAIAIWIVRQGDHDPRPLVAAIDHASAVGWWPRAFDLGALLEPVPSDDAEHAQGEFGALWQQAVDLQLKGDFTGARDCLLRAIDSVGGEAAGHSFYAAQYRLGTVCLDLDDLNGAARHFAIAEGGAADGFVTADTLAHIFYGKGVLALRNGRPERAVERFKFSIAQAQRLGLNVLLCLNFEALAKHELEQASGGLHSGHPDSEIARKQEVHFEQASLYLRSARAAEARCAEPTPEAGTLLLLEGRLLAARSRRDEARELGQAAVAAYRRWGDHRVSEAVEFLTQLDS